MTSDDQQAAAHWPQPARFGRSIRLEFALYVSGLILTLMIVTGYVISRQYVATVTHGVIDKLLIQARSYSSSAGKMFISAHGPDVMLLSDICNKIGADNADIFWAAFTDTAGTFVAHTDIREVMAGHALDMSAESADFDQVRDGERLVTGTDTILTSVPIREHGIVLGHLAVAASARVIAEARAASIRTVSLITAFMIVVGIPLTVIVVRRKLRPISDMAIRMQEVDVETLALEMPPQRPDELGYLAATIGVLGSRLRSAQDALIEKERLSRELEIAREIQTQMLPDGVPQFERGAFAVSYESAREVGGDYYDFIDFGDEKTGIIVADVSGKSLPGMLVMLMTRDIVKSLSRTISDPVDILTTANRELMSSMRKGTFVTMFYGLLDRNAGALTFASAGHNPLVHVHGATGTIDLIKTKGFPLGMMPPAAFDPRLERAQIAFAPDDVLVVYTDGVNEAKNPAQEEFGMDRFLAAVRQYRALPPPEMIDRTLRDHSSFVGDAPQYDDITFLAMKWLGAATDRRIDVKEDRVNTP